MIQHWTLQGALPLALQIPCLRPLGSLLKGPSQGNNRRTVGVYFAGLSLCLLWLSGVASPLFLCVSQAPRWTSLIQLMSKVALASPEMGVDLNVSYNVPELRNPCPQSALHLSWGVCNANYLSHSEKGEGHTPGVLTALKSVLSTQVWVSVCWVNMCKNGRQPPEDSRC